MTDFYSDFTR